MRGDGENPETRDFSLLFKLRHDPWFRYKWYLRVLFLVILLNVSLVFVDWLGIV